jgi:hypothetical protein
MNDLESVRRAHCAACVGKCWAFNTGRVAFGDPAAGCSRQIWARPLGPVVVPPSTVPVIAAQPVQASLLRTVRGWKRAGIRLVDRSERRQRGPICAGCDYVIRHPNGLVGCGAGCNCGAAAVSVMRQDAACKRKLWPASIMQRG